MQASRLKLTLILLLILAWTTLQPEHVLSERETSAQHERRPAVAGSYREAKRWLFEVVHAGRRTTLYCGCRFDANKRLDPGSCGYRAIRDQERAARAEAEHVIPASWIGQGRACWTKKICRDDNGKPFGGRDCCEAIDRDYQRAAFDLINLWPALGDLNARRSNFRFAEVPGEGRALGRCDVEIDPDARTIEPRPAIRGDIARIGLYMADVHGVRLSRHHRQLFEAWRVADPPDAAERERDARIRALQGRGNPLVEAAPGDLARELAATP